MGGHRNSRKRGGITITQQKIVNCSICGDKIIRVRYNITFELERQDFPPSGNWQKSVDRFKENVCPTCCNNIFTRPIHLIFDNPELILKEIEQDNQKFKYPTCSFCRHETMFSITDQSGNRTCTRKDCIEKFKQIKK